MTSKYITTKEIAEITGLSSRKVNEALVNEKLMYKTGDDWIATKKGEVQGAKQKEGGYGKYLTWPEEIVEFIDGDILPF